MPDYGPSIQEHSKAFQELMSSFDSRFDVSNMGDLFTTLQSNPDLIGEILDSLVGGKDNPFRDNIFFLDALKQHIYNIRPRITREQLHNLVVALGSLYTRAGSAYHQLIIFEESFDRVIGGNEN